jgi:hypothetical protein
MPEWNADNGVKIRKNVQAQVACRIISPNKNYRKKMSFYRIRASIYETCATLCQKSPATNFKLFWENVSFFDFSVLKMLSL